MLFFPDFAEKSGTALSYGESETVLLKLFTLFGSLFLKCIYLLGIMPFFFGFAGTVDLPLARSYRKNGSAEFTVTALRTAGNMRLFGFLIRRETEGNPESNNNSQENNINFNI